MMLSSGMGGAQVAGVEATDIPMRKQCIEDVRCDEPTPA